MKKKDYEKPAIKVVPVRIQSPLLDSSTNMGMSNSSLWDDGGSEDIILDGFANEFNF